MAPLCLITVVRLNRIICLEVFLMIFFFFEKSSTLPIYWILWFSEGYFQWSQRLSLPNFQREIPKCISLKYTILSDVLSSPPLVFIPEVTVSNRIFLHKVIQFLLFQYSDKHLRRTLSSKHFTNIKYLMLMVSLLFSTPFYR